MGGGAMPEGALLTTWICRSTSAKMSGFIDGSVLPRQAHTMQRLLCFVPAEGKVAQLNRRDGRARVQGNRLQQILFH